MYDPMQLLGKAVKKARLERGLTQSDVAERIDVDVRTVLKIENQKGNPKMEILFPLIRELRIDVNGVFYPELHEETTAMAQFQRFVSQCTEDEILSILPICEAVLSVLRAQDFTSLHNNL